jgi:zinc protease
MFRGDYHKLFTAPERYEGVTRAQIQDLARRTFDEKNRTVGVLIPEKEQAAR